MVAIPRLDGPRDSRPGPGWVEVVCRDNGAPLKPYIRCNCGKLLGIGLHSVAKDGTVTASFLHDAPGSDPCGWHEFLKLDGYAGPAFGPGEGR
jgi:hypothetical protein